jgi:hypothetical protein
MNGKFPNNRHRNNFLALCGELTTWLGVGLSSMEIPVRGVFA